MGKNFDESRIMDIANSIPEVCARLATLEEDCGFHKADVILKVKGISYYLQVSKTPKSKKENKKLRKRGTLPISTYRFEGVPYSDSDIERKIKDIICY